VAGFADAAAPRASGEDELAWLTRGWSWPWGSAIAAGLFALAGGLLLARLRRAATRPRKLTALQAQRLDARRREAHQQLAAHEHGWRELWAQVLADTLGQVVQLATDLPPRLAGTPAPYLALPAQDGRVNYLLTTDPERLRRVGLLHRQDRVVHLDASLDHTRAEVQVLWAHLATRWLPDAPAVPRAAPWYLVVQEAAA